MYIHLIHEINFVNAMYVYSKLCNMLMARQLYLLGSQIQTAERHLKNCYEKSHFTVMSEFEEWPPNRPKCFVNIALVQHKDKERSKHEREKVVNLKYVEAVRTVPKSVNKYHRLSLRHNMKPRSLKAAEMFLKHNSIIKDIRDIFHSTQSKVILIEGAAGIGKTYLCKEIAYQWSRGKILPEKKLLFLLFLYEQRVQLISSVKDLVECSCQQENDETIESLVRYLQDSEGDSLTILLDGYNEVFKKLPYDHFINRIVHILPKCMLVITSRSFAWGSLCNLAECRFEILGFTNNDRQRYINQALKDSPSEIAKVKQYFVDNLTISSLCYIPLNMAIFLYLFKQNDLPNSYTELHKKFIELMIKYHIKKSGQSYEKLQTLTETIMLNLAQFSYNVLCDGQLAFSCAQIKKACPEIFTQIPEAIHGFGLLQVTEHFSTEAPEKTFTFNFAHSSIQDYLAALYIQSLPDDKQLDLLRDTFWNEKYMNAWILFVGLTRGKTIAFRRFLSGKSSIRSRLSGDFQNFHISTEILSDKLKCFHLFQCFKEANDTDMYKRVGESLENDQIDLSGKTLLPKHVITLAFFLVQSRKYTSSWDKLDLSNCNMHDITCFMLLRALNFQEARICIKIIDLSCNKLTVSSAGTLASLVEECGTEELDITGNQLGDEGAEYFSSCLIGNTTLRLLMMDGNNINSSVAGKVELEMTTTTSLQIIGITSHQLHVKNECGSHITDVLQHYSSLTKFSMTNCTVIAEEMTAILKLLTKNINLDTIHFSHNDLGRIEPNAYVAELSTLKCLSIFTLLEPDMLSIAADELIYALDLNLNANVVALSDHKLQVMQTSCIKISQILQSNPSIVFLEIPKFFVENEESVDLLMAAINETPLLQKIDISHNNLNTTGVQKFATAIKNTNNLKSLIMKSNDINENAANILADSLQHKFALEVLDLGVNRIHTKGAIKISQALKNNTSLQVLNLHNNAIETSAAEEISLMLTNKRRLLEIDISQNSFKSEGITIIAKALQSINSLKVINFSSNKITSEASNHISSVLRNNPLLESINFSHNKLKASGCISICKALKNHYQLKVFNISCNDIKSEAAHFIAHCLKGKFELQTFSIYGNNLETGITTIMSELKFATKKLKELNLNNSGKINHKAAENLCQVIRDNPMLEVLDISYTQLQKLGAAKIFNALTSNKSLQVLNVSYNQIDDAAIDNLIRSLSNNVALRELKFHGNPISEAAVEQFVTKILLLNFEGLRHIKFPCINDKDIKSAIATRIERINTGRKTNNKLEWFSW